MRIFVYEYLSGSIDNAAPARCTNLGADADADADADGDRAALCAAGRAMRDALVADLAAIEGVRVSCACATPADASAAAEPRAQPVLPADGEPPDAFVRRAAALHDHAWIVAPESAGLLARLCAVVEPRRWIGCTPAALRLCGRKRATVARLAAHGLVTPLAFDVLASRWIVKPDDGAGCQRTRLHETHAAAQADLQARRARNASATLEPWVDGEALSVSLVCGDARGDAIVGAAPGARPGAARTSWPVAPAGHVELLSINRQRIVLAADGHLQDAGVAIGHLDPDDAHDPRVQALRDTALAVVRAVPGLRGFVGIDVVWHARRGPVVIEVNPRVTCAYVGLSAARGRNVAAAVLAAHGAAPFGTPDRMRLADVA